MGGDGVLVAYHRDLQSDQLKRVESTGFRGFSVLIQLAFEKSVHFRLRVNFCGSCYHTRTLGRQS